MSTARQRRGFAGVTKLRKTLRRLEPESSAGIKKALTDGARDIHFDMYTNVPKDTGETAYHLSYKIARDGLTARIGLIGKKDVAAGYAAQFIEYGTKGYPKRNIPKQRARPFMRPAFDRNKNKILQNINREIEKALYKLTSEPDNA